MREIFAENKNFSTPRCREINKSQAIFFLICKSHAFSSRQLNYREFPLIILKLICWILKKRKPSCITRQKNRLDSSRRCVLMCFKIVYRFNYFRNVYSVFNVFHYLFHWLLHHRRLIYRRFHYRRRIYPLHRFTKLINPNSIFRFAS